MKNLKHWFAILIVFIGLTHSQLTNAQITINNTRTAQQLVDSLKGSGITVSNVVFKGVQNVSGQYQLGYFSATGTTQTQLGMSKGLVLTNGNTVGIAGTQSATQTSTSYATGTTGEIKAEADATILCGTSNNFNVAILEFDFIPTGDSVFLKYIFSSAEYQNPSNTTTNDNCSDYNDKMGILISGSGISGGKGYANDAKNIAVLPNNANVEICVNSINNGIVGSTDGSPSVSKCQAANPGWVQGTPSTYFNGVVSGITFNGNTKVLTAKAKVTAQQQYHLKILISDVVDGAYDSGVFLEMNSFSSKSSVITTSARPSTLCTLGNSYVKTKVNIGTPPYSFSWSNGTVHSNITAAEDSILVSPTVTTTYTVTVTDNAAKSSISSVAITVDNLATTVIAPKNLCKGSSLSLGASFLITGGVANYSYSWSNGSTLSNPSVLPTINTTYTVTVTDSKLCAIQNTITVNVIDLPIVNAGKDSTICKGNSVQLNATGASTYSWSPTTNLSNSAISNPITTPTASITYVVTGTSNGCTASDNIAITVNAKATTPVITRNLDSLKSSVTSMIQWYNLGGLLSSETKYYYLPQQTNTYYAIANNVYGCKSDTSNKYVFNTDIPVVSASVLSNYICQNASTKLIAKVSMGTPPYTYKWSSGKQTNPTTLKTDTTIVSPTITTTYTLTVTDSKPGTANSITSTVVVTVDNIAATVIAPQNLCKGSSLSLGASSLITGGVINFSYSWSNGSTLSNPTVAPSVNTTYTVTVTDSKSCTAQNTITVNMLDRPIVNAGKDSIICKGGFVQLNATGASAYSWNPSTYINNTIVSNPITTPTASITYVVTGSLNGCTASDNIAITVNAKATTPVVTRNLDSLKSSITTNIQWYNLGGILSGESKSYHLPQQTNTYYAIANNAYGCKSDTSNKYMFNLAIPIVSTSVLTNNICKGASTKLVAKASTGIPPYTYKWSSGGQTNATTLKTDTTIVSPTITTTYTVTITDSNSPTANTATSSVVVSVNTLYAVAISDKNVCKGSSVSLTNGVFISGGSGIYTYNWSNGSTLSIPSVSPTQNTKYYVTASDGKCTVKDSVLAIYNDVIPSVVASKDTNVCSGSTISISVTGATTYSWSPTTYLSSSSIANPIVTPTSTTTYVVTGWLNSCSASDNIVITANPKATTPTVSFSNDSLRSTVTSDIQWYGPSGIINGETKPAYLPAADGGYYVIANNQYKCPSSASTAYKYYSDIRINKDDTLTIYQIINTVNIDTLTRYVRELTGEDLATAGAAKVSITTRATTNGRNYMMEAFQRYGLSPVLQTYSTGANVYAIQQGVKNPEKLIFITAHYDQVANYCADDDASGTAAVMEAARILSKYTFDNTIVYALWDQEEVGHVGSAYYVNQAKLSNPQIIGDLQLEMFGYDSNNDNLFEIHVRDYASSYALKDLTIALNTKYKIGLTPVIQNPGTTSSDHNSFWTNGYGAICTSEAFFHSDGNPSYHSSDDRISLFNLPYFHKLAKLNIAELATIANWNNATTAIKGINEGMTNLFSFYPNPGKEEITVITSATSNDAFVTICNLQGQLLIKEKLNESVQRVSISTLKAGIYFVNVEMDGIIQAKKLIKM